MSKPQRLRLLAPLTLMFPSLLIGTHAAAQSTWPSGPIRLVVPFPPGGSSDILGRLIADQIGKTLGANFFVENKPGGTTQIGTEAVASSPADGNTWLLAAATSFTQLPNLRKLSYSLDSFESAGGIADYIGVMAVRKTLPIKNMKEFVAYAKANPGKLSFGSAGEASAGHVFGLTLARDTGINVLHVPYKGSAAAVNGLLTEEIDFIIDGAVSPMVKADKVQPLCVFYSQRHPDLPAVPTLKESGFEITQSKSPGWGLLAPKGTPKAIVSQMSNALRKALETKSVQDALARANTIAAWMPPEEYGKALLNDQKMYAELLPTIGIRGN
ncbi:tripartite tricarboxylate transporter substrate binding protein [Ottowia caeni]|uniref:Bug family tripartite tricarboxylate transporter substrate binding protein n=1 Tax=Ottowia caeni TaxID=2870339 RepID=UPI001E42723B|nr:tripartite tricarboxylate transporter substrate binding protein [Ottowia caeni]